MDKQAAFSIEQYAYFGKPINSKSQDLINYIARNKITLTRNQAAIACRFLVNLKIGDVLTPDGGDRIFITRFNAYSKEMDFMSAGMTCLIIIEGINVTLKEGQLLFLEK